LFGRVEKWKEEIKDIIYPGPPFLIFPKWEENRRENVWHSHIGDLTMLSGYRSVY
jgi:hypothetical protein